MAHNNLLAAGPSADSLRATRNQAALSQTAAAELVGAKLRTWQDWEAGVAQIPPASWSLFLLATGQHPTHRARPRLKPL